MRRQIHSAAITPQLTLSFDSCCCLPIVIRNFHGPAAFTPATTLAKSDRLSTGHSRILQNLLETQTQVYRTEHDVLLNAARRTRSLKADTLTPSTSPKNLRNTDASRPPGSRTRHARAQLRRLGTAATPGHSSNAWTQPQSNPHGLSQGTSAGPNKKPLKLRPNAARVAWERRHR